METMRPIRADRYRPQVWVSVFERTENISRWRPIFIRNLLLFHPRPGIGKNEENERQMEHNETCIVSAWKGMLEMEHARHVYSAMCILNGVRSLQIVHECVTATAAAVGHGSNSLAASIWEQA